MPSLPGPSMSSTLTPHTSRATFAIGDERTARRVVDLLNESLDEDQSAVAAFERPDGHWDISLHFAEPPDQASIRELVSLAAGDEVARHITFDTVEAKDWVKASLEDLVPVPAGRFIVHGGHDRARIAPNRLGIEIEAALAFGTGHHGTTRACLLALDWIAKTASPRRVLDVGTGTGVLAIAAAKALKTPVLASDIDPRSVIVARDNAVLNAAAPWTAFVHAAGLQAHRFAMSGPFDLVMANILLGPLTQLAPRIARLLKPGARVVLSGLLDKQAQTALIAYRAQGLVPEKRISLDGWTT